MGRPNTHQQNKQNFSENILLNIEQKKLQHLSQFFSSYFTLIKNKTHVNTSFKPYLRGLFGGGDERRTRVRKPIRTTFYECSLSFKIPLLLSR